METARHQQQRVHDMDEQRISNGDRVRLKGDHEGHWLTVKRVDHLERDPNNPNGPQGWFCTVAYWTEQPPGAPVLAEMSGFRLDCLTKDPVPDRPSRAPVRLTKPTLKRGRRQ